MLVKVTTSLFVVKRRIWIVNCAFALLNSLKKGKSIDFFALRCYNYSTLNKKVGNL